MSKPKTERNNWIVEMRDKKDMTFIAITDLHKEKYGPITEKNVIKIYNREKVRQAKEARELLKKRAEGEK